VLFCLSIDIKKPPVEETGGVLKVKSIDKNESFTSLSLCIYLIRGDLQIQQNPQMMIFPFLLKKPDT